MPGSILGAGASLGAASMQADAANHATDVQMDMYNRTRSDLLPYSMGGQGAFSNLSYLTGQNGIPNTGMGQPSSSVPGYPPAGNLGLQPQGYSGVPYGPQALQGGGQQPSLTWADGSQGSPQAANFFTTMLGMQPGGQPSDQLFGNANVNRGSFLPTNMPTANSPYNQTYSDGMPIPNQPMGPNVMSATGNPMLSALRNYPGYQFAQEEGVQALDRSAASRGQVLSGGQLRAVSRYGTGLADQLYGQYFDQNYQLASLGENAAAQTGNAGSNAAAGAARSSMAAGEAWASGLGGAANQIGSNLPKWDPFGSSGGSSGNWAGSVMDDGTVIPSDRRLKTDIKPVGRLESGLTVYSYRLKGSPATQMGVMSDEVREVAPQAVRRHPDGFDRVDYRQVSMLPKLKRAA